MNEHDYAKIVDYLLGALGFLLIAWGRYMFNRIANLEEKLAEQTKELHEAIDDQGHVFREEHGKLRDQMAQQHDRIVGILLQQHNGNGE